METLHVEFLVDVLEEGEAHDAIVGAAVEFYGGETLGCVLFVDGVDSVGVKDLVDAGDD